MKTRGVLVLAFLAFGMLAAPGCLSSIAGTGSSEFSQDYRNSLQQYAIYDEKQIQDCKLGVCICMPCKNRTAWFGFLTSYAGGSCRFQKNCTPEVFNRLVNKTLTPAESPHQFMIGQGYSFSDWGDANPYCGNRLDMAVQWLVGSNSTNYSLPDPERAMCLLDKGIMPVYVLYSNGKAVNYAQTRKIAELLGKKGPSVTPAGALIMGGGGPVGPVIVTTEMDFNSSSPDFVQNVTKQIDAINNGCQNKRTGGSDEEIHCFVALGIQMGDYEGLKKIMDALPDKKQVDLVAFGVNAHTVNLTGSRDAYCNPDYVFQQALKFARYSLYNYSKPTVMPYVMLDAAGTDGYNSCNWTEIKMTEGYSSLFSTWLLPLQKAGVIGIAAYDFNSSQFGLGNPLGCLDCSLGKNGNRMRSWFGPCRSYKLLSAKYPAGDNMIVFSNESGGTCDYSLNPMGIFQMAYGSYANAITPDLTPPNATLVRCDSCVNENYTFPLGGLTPSFAGKEYCTKYPVLDFYSSKRNLDPMLVRAIVLAEAPGFDPCAAACVSLTPRGGCLQECYGKAYDYVPDPEGICHNADQPKQQGVRYCGLGLMQILEPPYTFWPAALRSDNTPGQYYTGYPNDQLYLEALNKGRSGLIAEAKAECSDRFNPFNVSHAACFGTYKFARNLDTAKGIVSANTLKLGAGDPNTQRIYAYYLALHFYRGDRIGGTYDEYEQTTTPGWIDDFAAKKQYTEEFCARPENKDSTGCTQRLVDKCYGETDFIKFVRKCKFEDLGKPDYGSRVLSYYLGLTQNCDNAVCPSWKRLQSLACKNIPLGGMPGENMPQCISK